jgi:hypothetical protein
MFDNSEDGGYDAAEDEPITVNNENCDILNGRYDDTCRQSGNLKFRKMEEENLNLPQVNFHKRNGKQKDMCQLNGNESIGESDQDSVMNYDSEDEVDSAATQAVLVPAPRLAGQPFTLIVDDTEEVAAPSSLPLTMVANLRSAYNKVKNMKRNLYTLGLDIMIVSETWERPRLDLNKLLDSPNYVALSYCRGRETPATRVDGRHAGKMYPGKTGGGAAIIFNPDRFEASDTDIGVPLGVKAKWCVFSPRRLDHQLQRVKRICVGAIKLLLEALLKMKQFHI